MANALEEQILAVMKTKLAAIVGVTVVERASGGPEPLRHAPGDRPLIQIRHVGTSRRWHLRGAYENVLYCELILSTAQNDATIRNLIGDVVKTIDANARWNDGVSNLADRSWCGSQAVHETETQEASLQATLPVNVLFYESVLDPTAVKEI